MCVNIGCVICTSVNYCWFKNEKNKKPDDFDYTNSNISETANELYHPRCHCVQKAIKTLKPEDIKLIIPEGKIGWLIKDKGEWIKAMGYKNDQKFIDVLLELTKEAFVKGKYEKVIHNKFGFKINIEVAISEQSEKFLI